MDDVNMHHHYLHLELANRSIAAVVIAQEQERVLICDPGITAAPQVVVTFTQALVARIRLTQIGM